MYKYEFVDQDDYIYSHVHFYPILRLSKYARKPRLRVNERTEPRLKDKQVSPFEEEEAIL